MANEFIFEIDADAFIERFGTRIPQLTRENALRAMQEFMGKLDERVHDNIASMFHHDTSAMSMHDRTVRLEDSMLATVRQEGDLVVGEYGYDLEETPYARILEMGGRISAHSFGPSSANALAIPVATLAEGAYEDAKITEDGLFITTFWVNHPGADIHAYHYILSAVVDLSKEFSDDLQLAVIQAYVDSGRG